MLGGNIAAEFSRKFEISGVYRNHPNTRLLKQYRLDLADPAGVIRLSRQLQPDAIIHCAAFTDVEACEENYELAHNCNALTARNLLSAFGRQIKFIYISTDSVFDGRKGDYSEMDTPSPLNNYAKTKLEGEMFVEEMSDNYAIIRANIIGWNHVKGESFAEWVLRSLSEKNPIRMFSDVIFSPVSANTLAVFIDKLLEMDFTGKLNIASEDFASKYEFGVRLSRAFGLDSSLIAPASVDEFRFKAKRSKNTSLNTSKAKARFGRVPTLEEEINLFYDKKVRCF